MKTDTEYFQIALDAYCKAHRLDAMMPLTPVILSQLLRSAQALKDADKKRIETEPTA